MTIFAELSGSPPSASMSERPWTSPTSSLSKVRQRDVGVDRALGQPVVGDDGDAGVLGLLHAVRDGVRVDRVQHDHVDLVLDHLLHLVGLLGGAGLGVGVLDDALVTRQLADLLLEEGVVELLVARVLLLRQQQSDQEVVALGGAGVVAALRRAQHAAGGQREGHQGRGHGYGDSTGTAAHCARPSDTRA